MQRRRLFLTLEFALKLTLPLLFLSVFLTVAFATPVQQAGAEVEPNHSFGTAEPLVLNAAVTATISPTRDVDWFAFTVEQQGELRLSVTDVAPQLAINVRVWTANKDTLTGWFAPTANGGDTEAVVDLPAPGRYYLEVAGGDNNQASDQPYTLTTVFTASVDQGEPNHNFGSAMTLPLGQAIQATLLPAGDTDWFTFAVDQHGELQLTISDVAAELAVNLRVWTANKDALTGWFAPLAKGGDTMSVVDLPLPGIYYVEVAAGDGAQRAIQPYTLLAAFTPSADLNEPNNTFGAAVALPLSQPLQATILPVNDSDWFYIDVDHHGELRLSAVDVAPELTVFLRVWTANKDTLTGWLAPLAAGGDTAAVVDLAAPGRYYLEVSGDNGQRALQPFRLRADFTPAADSFEPNNSFGAAAELGVDRSVQANILPANDKDWFVIAAPHHGELRVAVTDVTSDLAVFVRVWTANKDTLTGWFAPLALGGDTEAVVDLPAPGNYYLEIGGDNGQRSIQPYQLQTTFSAAVDQGEPNNTLETATPVNLDETIPGNILPAGDRDWCKLEILESGELHIVVVNAAPELTISFRLWDSNQQTLSNWFRPLSQGGNVEATIPIAEPGVYYLEVADNSSSARSIEPYLLHFSMQPIDPTTVVLPTQEAAPTITSTSELAPTATGTILTSGQVGPLGAELFVQTPEQPDVNGARLTVPPDTLDELATVDIAVSDMPPAGAPFGLQPAGHYWIFTPDGLQFKQPVTLTLPAPTGSAGPQLFIGHWNGEQWEDLGGSVEDGLITAATEGFSAFGVFCGRLAAYQAVRIENASSSPYLQLTYVAGPTPDPDNPDAEFVSGCPLPYAIQPVWELKQGDSTFMLLRPGRYHFIVSYPQPQPGVANGLYITIPPAPAGGQQIIRIEDTGAVSDNPDTKIDFPGAQVTAGANLAPTIACNAEAPGGVVLTSGDPATAGLPSRVVLIDQLKLEQLPSQGEGVRFTAVATDPEGKPLRPYWTLSGGLSSLPIAGDFVESGAPIADQYTFHTTLAGQYTLYLTVYDSLGLFAECRWVLNVQPNARPQIDVVSGRTWIEFGRLDEERMAGVGPIIPVLTPVRAGSSIPLPLPSVMPDAPAVIWDGLALCPTGAAGPFAVLPEVDALLTQPAPVDVLLPTDPTVSTDVTNRWAFYGRTCVWALVADADGDLLTIAWEFPGPIFGSGTFYAAVSVPAGFHPDAPAGIPLGTLLRTYDQLRAYNAWVSLLYNSAGVTPAIVWEAWDDPCPPGSGNVENPCPTSISRGGVENIVARVTDGFALPPTIGFTAIGVGPEAFADDTLGFCAPVFFISSLTPVPSNPAPRQGVRVTARVSPITENCTVRLEVVGTDGYNDLQFIRTNKSGEATLFIPGGDEDVVDVVTAEVCRPFGPNATPPPPDQTCETETGLPGWLIRMEVTYTF